MALDIIKVDVDIDLGRFERHLKPIGRQGSPQMRQARVQWIGILSQFLRDRFLRFSKGGRGRWRKLAPSTLEEKRRLGYPDDILVRTGLMLSTFTPENQLYSAEPVNPVTIDITYGGGVFYPSGQEVSAVIGFHQRGGKKLPRRKVIVPPPRHIRRRMARIMKDAIASTIEGIR